VRWIVAGRETTPLDALEILADDPDRDVRIEVALNPRVTAHLLARMARDPDPLVRSAVARSINLSKALADQLRRDPDPFVRRQVAFRSCVFPLKHPSVL